MLALACDRRVMASGRAKISLNEVAFGASVFAGCVEMLRAVAGHRNAEEILFGGAMYTAKEAQARGLVDRVVPPEVVFETAIEEARAAGSCDAVAYRSIKRLLRGPLAADIRRREPASIREFVEIWYSEPTWERLKAITIRP